MKGRSRIEAPTDDTSLHCAVCGYDLRGLPRPPRCPECGHVAGREADRQAALNWYRSARGLFFIGPPPAVMIHLHHPAAQRAAVRRFIVWFALPWAVLCSLIAVLSSIVTVNTYERWWEPVSQPGQRRDVDRVTHERWLLGDPDDFGGVHTPNAKVGNKVYRSARVSTRLRLAQPRPATGLAELILAVCLCVASAVLCAWLITLAGLAWVWWTGGGRVHPRAALCAASWMIPANLLWVLCAASVLLGTLSATYSLRPTSLACVLLPVGLAHLAWGTAVMWKTGLALRAPRLGVGWWLALIMAAAWLLTIGVAFVFLLGGAFLLRARV